MLTRTLLLADDSVTIQKVVNLTFADEGIQVIAVSDGDAAMKKFVESAPDLVMVDVNMPGLDGYRICEIIKQDAETKHIPVILLVGSFEPFDETEARRVGADDFLTKPFQSIRQLVERVFDLLDGKKVEKDFSSPIIESASAAIVDDPYDSQKLKSSDEIGTADGSIERRGDAGMDDEIIQTSQINFSAADKAITEYESAPVDETLAEEINLTASKPLADFDESLADEFNTANKESAQTPPLTTANIEEAMTLDSAFEKETASALNFERFETLEYPELTPKAVADQIVVQTGSGISVVTASEIELAKAEAPGQNIERVTTPRPTESFSPELVEAIADRVAEKIVGRHVENIVREVIRQMEEKR